MTENWRKDSEYMSYVADLLATPEVQKLSQYKQHVNSTRLEHSLSVSYYSYKLAKNGAVMQKQQLEQAFYMIYFTMIGARRNLTKVLMLICILELPLKMRKKSLNYPRWKKILF